MLTISCFVFSFFAFWSASENDINEIMDRMLVFQYKIINNDNKNIFNLNQYLKWFKNDN